MNLFLIISSLLTTVAVAQDSSVNCNYRFFGRIYACDLIINNPNGLNNFTEIGGIHFEGYTNVDVDYVVRLSGVSSNIPSIICDTFTNVFLLDLYNTGLTVIDDSSFRGCPNIAELYFDVNRISSISANAFVNIPLIWSLDLDENLLTTLPENVFASQRNLTALFLSFNAFEDIPVGVFQPLENLQRLELDYNNLTAINNQWFTSNTHLSRLNLAGNRIAASADNFVNLDSLLFLSLANNGINEIQHDAFARLPNLQSLYLYDNNFTEIQADSFASLGQLNYLDISGNPLDLIHEGAFRGLGNLTTLDISSCRIRQLNANSFVNLVNLSSISLNSNEIEALPWSLFVPLPNLNYIGLGSNRLKTLSMSSFGSLINLRTLDLDGNVLNALDRAIIDEAVNLNTLYFNGNLCANNFFGNFLNSRDQYLPILERCFVNFRFIVETITEADNVFSFFEGPHPGIALRVNTDNEVQIALTPFNFIWSPIIEILIGTTNNTRSGIRVNQETDVVTVPTPNIIIRDRWNDFRVTWESQVVLVYRGNNSFPFRAYTMQDFFPVNFYGLRAVGTSASWSVQPFLV